MHRNAHSPGGVSKAVLGIIFIVMMVIVFWINLPYNQQQQQRGGGGGRDTSALLRELDNKTISGEKVLGRWLALQDSINRQQQEATETLTNFIERLDTKLASVGSLREHQGRGEDGGAVRGRELDDFKAEIREQIARLGDKIAPITHQDRAGGADAGTAISRELEQFKEEVNTKLDALAGSIRKLTETIAATTPNATSTATGTSVH